MHLSTSEFFNQFRNLIERPHTCTIRYSLFLESYYKEAPNTSITANPIQVFGDLNFV